MNEYKTLKFIIEQVDKLEQKQSVDSLANQRNSLQDISYDDKVIGITQGDNTVTFGYISAEYYEVLNGYDSNYSYIGAPMNRTTTTTTVELISRKLLSSVINTIKSFNLYLPVAFGVFDLKGCHLISTQKLYDGDSPVYYKYEIIGY